MAALADWFFMGGPVMWLLLLLGSGAMAGSVVVGAIALTARRTPAALAFVLPAALVSAGAAGTLIGLQEAMAAIAHAAPEMQGPLAHMGMAIASVTHITGLVLAALALLIYTLLGGLAAVLARGDHGPAVQAEHRLGVAVATLAGGAAAAHSVHQYGAHLAHQAIARASPEVVSVLVRDATDTQQGAWIWLLVGVVASVGALAALVPVARHLSPRRAALLAAVTLGGGVLYGGLFAQSHRLTTQLSALGSAAQAPGIDR